MLAQRLRRRADIVQMLHTCSVVISANTRRCTNSYLVLARRLRRRPNTTQTFVQRLVFARYTGYAARICPVSINIHGKKKTNEMDDVT